MYERNDSEKGLANTGYFFSPHSKHVTYTPLEYFFKADGAFDTFVNKDTLHLGHSYYNTIPQYFMISSAVTGFNSILLRETEVSAHYFLDLCGIDVGININVIQCVSANFHFLVLTKLGGTSKKSQKSHWGG